jgi:hypothetical protein
MLLANLLMFVTSIVTMRLAKCYYHGSCAKCFKELLTIVIVGLAKCLQELQLPTLLQSYLPNG